MKIKVLIVEDEMLVAEDLSDSLADSGFDVCGIASSADECFEILKSAPPDLVLMDIAIQGKLDGIETARIIAQTKGIPLIFLTANADPATLERALPINPDAFITKPFNIKDLTIAIELACRKHNERVFQSASGDHDVVRNSIFVRDGRVYKRVDVPAILYVEAKGSYSQIITAAKTFTLSYNLTHFVDAVRNPVFKRVHRSFIVNVNKVEAIDQKGLIINKSIIPVSKQYQKEVFALFVKI